MTTLPEVPRAPVLDQRTGLMSREWVRFFDDLRKALLSSLDDAVGGRLDALEAESLFGGGDGAGGGNADYNDAALRGRLEALETELMFPAAIPRNDAAELEARLAFLESISDDASLDTAFPVAPEPGDLRSRMAAVELSLATIDDSTAKLRMVLQRMATLETDCLFKD